MRHLPANLLAVLTLHAAALPWAAGSGLPSAPAGSLAWEAPAAEPELQFPEWALGGVEWGDALIDPEVEPAQVAAQAPPAPSTSRFTRSQGDRPLFSTASLRTGATGAAGFAGLASVPYMFGDTGAGTCLQFGTLGYLEGGLSHPTLTCSRLNISENNRAVCSDRVYFSYRHFNNATPGMVFQFSQNLDVDRFTLGVEKTFADGACSIEVRTPLEDRLTSRPLTRAYDLAPSDGNIDPETAQLLGGRELELANMSAIFKVMLAEHEGFLLSAGLGVTAPTARDVVYTVDTQLLPVTYPFDTPFVIYSNYQTETHFTNETWYLSPFLAWANRGKGRFFYQGFMQFEVPANPTRVRFTDFGSVGVVTTDLNYPPATFDFGVGWTVNGVYGGSALLDLHAQPLMRVNLGGGYFLVEEEDRHRWFDQLVAMLEVHYTTTLQDAKLTRIPLEVTFVGLDAFDLYPQDAFDPILGNLNSRVDILNGVLGLSAVINGTTIANGFTMPLRSGDNRGFDFEYNLQIQRPF